MEEHGEVQMSSLVDKNGRPFDPLAVVPTEVIQRKTFRQDDRGCQVVLEESNVLYEKELQMKVGYMLSRAYKGYGWAVRTICSDIQALRHVAGKERTIGIGILLAELLHWGGSKAVMYINPQDWTTEEELKKLVINAGGELLERSRLLRSGKSDDQWSDTLPDGFADVLPQVKKDFKVVHNKHELMTAIENHIQKQEAIESQSTDVADDAK